MCKKIIYAHINIDRKDFSIVSINLIENSSFIEEVSTWLWWKQSYDYEDNQTTSSIAINNYRRQSSLSEQQKEPQNVAGS